MQLEVINIEGQKTGRTIELPDEIFGTEPNQHVVWLAVKQYLAAQRQGTASVKTRAEAQGSSRKLHKQKGTGGSRKGNLRNPLYKGGGSVFGPKPRDYSFKLNRKVKDLAKISALSSKARENQIVILEDTSLNMEKPSTKEFLQIFSKINNGARKTLFVLPEYNENIYKSYRNVSNICGTLLSDINTYDIVNAETVVFTETAAKIFVEDPEELSEGNEEITGAETNPEKEVKDSKEQPQAKAEKDKENEDAKVELPAEDSVEEPLKEETTEESKAEEGGVDDGQSGEDDADTSEEEKSE